MLDPCSIRESVRVSESAIRAYHGSGTDFDQFSYDFTGQGNDQIGSGFYFTSDPNEAYAYTSNRLTSDTPKLGGEDAPTIFTVDLDIKKPLDAEKIIPVSPVKIRKLLEMSPIFEEALQNWGDVEFEGREKVMREAVNAYTMPTRGEPLVRALFKVANDFYPDRVEAFNNAVTKVLGYDGVVMDWGNKKHYVAFRPDQVHVVSKKRR